MAIRNEFVSEEGHVKGVAHHLRMRPFASELPLVWAKTNQDDETRSSSPNMPSRSAPPDPALRHNLKAEGELRDLECKIGAPVLSDECLQEEDEFMWTRDRLAFNKKLHQQAMVQESSGSSPGLVTLRMLDLVKRVLFSTRRAGDARFGVRDNP